MTEKLESISETDNRMRQMIKEAPWLPKKSMGKEEIAQQMVLWKIWPIREPPIWSFTYTISKTNS